MMSSHTIELEPEGSSGYLRRRIRLSTWMDGTTTLLSDSLYNILSAQVTTNMITSITEDTQV